MIGICDKSCSLVGVETQRKHCVLRTVIGTHFEETGKAHSLTMESKAEDVSQNTKSVGGTDYRFRLPLSSKLRHSPQISSGVKIFVNK